MVAARQLSLLIFLAAFFVSLSIILNTPSHFVYEDEWFYIIIARNISHGIGSTFNGIIPTNGYHPLWMLFLIPITYASRVFALNDVVVAISIQAIFLLLYAFLYISSTKRLGLNVFLSGTVPVLFIYLQASLVSEAQLTLMLLAFALYYYSLFSLSKRGLHIYLCFLFLTLSVLSRLDYVFLLVNSGIVLLYYVIHPARKNGRQILLFFLILFTSILLASPYVTWNLVNFGGIVPVSGVFKSTFPEIYDPRFSRLGGLGTLTFSISVLGLVISIWIKETFKRVLIFVTSLSTFLHACYVMLFTTFGTAWHWYYVLGMVSSGILLDYLLSLLVTHNFISGPKAKMLLLHAAFSCFAILGTGWIYIKAEYPQISSLHSYYKLFVWSEEALKREKFADEIAYFLKANTEYRDVIFVLDMPGRLAFFSDRIIIPIDGVVADRQFRDDLESYGIVGYMNYRDARYFVGPKFDKWELDSVNRNFAKTTRIAKNGEMRFEILSPGNRRLVGQLIMHDRDIVFETRKWAVWKL